MYLSCLLIRNIISFCVRPAESPGQMSAASYRNLRDRRSILRSGSISHRPALVNAFIGSLGRRNARDRNLLTLRGQDLFLVSFDGRPQRAPIRN